jgi:hypothetical protein
MLYIEYLFYIRQQREEVGMNINFRKGRGITGMLKGVTVRRGLAWGVIIIFALLAFEIFNYSTTQFALADVLGNLKFAGIRWATILAIAFCGIDFAGIARLFTPEQGRDEPAEVWYLFGAWLLAAAMNATLTWWGVAVAISSHANQSSAVISSTTLTKVVPVFVAIMVWLIRVLIIGTFSVAGERLFSQADASLARPRTMSQTASPVSAARPRPSISTPFRPIPKSARAEQASFSRPEPTYHNVSLNSRPAREAEYVDNPRHS